MNNHKHTTLSALLFVFCMVTIPAPSSGFGMKGGGGSSGVAEILAAGLITGLLMEQRATRPMGRPMIQALMQPLMGRYMSAPRHPMQGLMSNSIPMMHPYAFSSMHRPQFIMNHAFMAQASHHHAFTARLNEEIRALEAQENMLKSYLARNQQGSAESVISELLAREEENDSIPAAALLLETAELIGQDGSLERPHPMTHQDMFEAASSEPESRYILPRIVRHFVQRLIRRGEQL